MLPPQAIQPAKPVMFTRPMLSVWAVLSVTRLASEYDVIAAVEDGRLRVAWNIAGSRAERKLLRVWAPSVSDFIQKVEPPAGVTTFEEFQGVIRSIFPRERPAISAGNVSRSLNCSGFHVSHLVRQGLLKVAQCGRARRPGAPQMLDYPSVVAFLEQRRYP